MSPAWVLRPHDVKRKSVKLALGANKVANSSMPLL
jgi:hypothetical protein